MNSDTGKIYSNPEDIRVALKRGEPLEPIGPRVAEQDKARGHVYRGATSPIAALTAFRGMPMHFPAPNLPRALTDFDMKQITKAQAKRDRKHQARAKGMAE